MNKSDTIGKLSLALSKLQGEVQNVHKDKQGYGYKYTELSSVLEVTRPLCAKHELAVTQLCGTDSVGVTIETVLLHSSGEWLSSTLSLPVTAGKGMSQAQAMGSCISYGRRYALTSLLGIAQTDNDAAIKEEPEEEAKPSRIQDGLKAKLAPPNALPLQRVFDLIKQHELKEKITGWCERFSVANLNDLTTDQALKLIKAIEANYNGN